MFLWYSKRLLTDRQISGLKKHKYATDNDSVLDPYMQPWWNWVVTFMPMWLAPNLITLSGLAVNLFFAFLLIMNCPNATENIPGWIPMMVAVGMFIYQTLDAIDGKQARRTGSSNALGELFDHGCDSISNLVLGVAGACAMSLGYLNPYWLLSYCYLGTFLFYLAHWQAYVTGRMRFGKIDATEAQFTMMSVMLFSGIFGTQAWGTQVFGFLSLRIIPLVFGTTLAFMSLPETVNRILFNGAGRHGATVAVAQMTKSDLDSYDAIFLTSGLMWINQSKDPLITEYNLLQIVCCLAVADYMLYCTRVIKDICDETGWPLLKINVKSNTTTAMSDNHGKNGSKAR